MPSTQVTPPYAYAPTDRSSEGILERQRAHAAQGYPEFDPVTRSRVVMRTNSRGRPVPEVRPVAETLEAALAGDEGRCDFYYYYPTNPELSTWLLGGVKKERDEDTLRGADFETEEL